MTQEHMNSRGDDPAAGGGLEGRHPGARRRVGRAALAVLLLTTLLTGVLAQEAQHQDPSAAAATADAVQPTMEQLRALRAVLAAYEDVAAAEADGFAQFGECMSGPQGAQGIHFTHGARIEDPGLDPLAPEVLMYEPRPDGSLRLIGAEFLVFQSAWHEAGSKPAPTLLGREFYLNTTLLDEPFYALHVWVWHENPSGLFANWNPLVACPAEAAAGH